MAPKKETVTTPATSSAFEDDIKKKYDEIVSHRAEKMYLTKREAKGAEVAGIKKKRERKVDVNGKVVLNKWNEFQQIEKEKLFVKDPTLKQNLPLLQKELSKLRREAGFLPKKEIAALKRKETEEMRARILQEKTLVK